MIVGEIKRYLRDNNAVRVSRSIRDLACHSMRAREELQKKTAVSRKSPRLRHRWGKAPKMWRWRWNPP